jgi:hypothetical protein
MFDGGYFPPLPAPLHVVNFERTHPASTGHISRTAKSSPERIMAIPKNEKHKEYARYAVHCLQMVPRTPDQEYRSIQREMAAEWIRLADAILRPPKPIR